ncbi:MAG: dihydrodipicolinate synthase family protein, partial [Bacteroidota bacterium]
VLLSLAALPDATDAELERHCRAVADVLPVFGFYLQPAVGGRRLGRDFWRRFAQIPGIAGIKIAPFDRYATLDVIRGLAEAGRLDDIPLYTGNDDTIVQDLLTPFDLGFDEPVTVRGGLLGHWACWTRRAVDLLERCKRARESGTVPGELLKVGAQVTDMNAALFDTDNGFAGAIAGVNEVLRRQGLLSSARCLAEHECLSPGQPEALDRVTQLYPHLTDDAFINAHLDDWLNR